MSNQAFKNGDEIIYTESFDDDSWDYLKKNYSIGDFKMTCCRANAIPKTSINFTKFFAHQNDFCETKPETVWHKSVKRVFLNSLIELGYQAEEEKQGDGWIADVYFELDDRKIAFEIQHSPQTLPVYFERTEKYNSDNVEVFWILYEDRFKTYKNAVKNKILKDMGLKLTRSEFKKELAKGFAPSLKELPVFCVKDDTLNVVNVHFFKCSIVEFIESIVHNRLIYDKSWKMIE